jgi:site-specific DNA-methyltransferase (adenine-specific)
MRVETIGAATLYLGDCLEILPTLGKVDAVLTDPPYASGGFTEAAKKSSNGMGNRSETRQREGWFPGDNMTTAGITWLLRSVAVDCVPLLPEGGTMSIFTDWRMLTALVPAIESARVRYQNLLVWNKGVAGLGAGFRTQHEMIMHFAVGVPTYHNLSNGNVITSPRMNHHDREHQTQKPIELMETLLSVVSKEGDLVLDPFMGSGTTGVACLNTARRFVGIEVEPAYFDIACERLSNSLRQGRLIA